jgi:hypothetical protein
MLHARCFAAALLLAVLALTPCLQADDTRAERERVVSEIRATRVNPEAPIIDGDLSDPFWQTHEFEMARDFIQSTPHEGEAATESTVVAIGYDDDALYAAFWNYDSQPDKIKRQLARRDRYTDADRVQILLDTYHDHQTGYLFLVNAAGSQRDFRLYSDVNMDMSWDAVWEAETKLQPWGWSAEFRIPYSCLRFSEKDIHTWGLNFIRTLSREAESSYWAFTPSSEGGVVSKFGHLTGLTGIKPATHLEVLPYTVSRLNTETKNQGNTDGRDFAGDIGLDLKYGISSNLVLDATINPDFGQVELDRPVLNLSSFETFYEEKRPFFLEGANLFSTSFDMFYSRRIGRSPRGWPDGVDYYTDRPSITTILGAGKLTGKISGKTSIAILNAVTQEETAEYVDESGIKREAVIEPKADYSVVRVTRDILNGSSVGIMGTAVTQETVHPAMTAGIDWRIFTNDAAWGVSGQAVTSRVDSENTGFGLDMTGEKAAGKHVRGALGIELYDPNLDLNDVGFLYRNDRREGWCWLQYYTQEEWWIFRKTWNNLNGYAEWNYNGDRIGIGWNVNSSFEFMNYWYLSGGVNQNLERWDDRETRGNGLWNNPSSWGWWASLSSDSRKPITFNINPGSGENRYGEWWANYIGFEIRPKSNMEFSIGANYVRGFSQTRWIDNLNDPETGETVSIFADLDQDEITPRISACVNFTRDLTLQFSGQMLISSLDHKNYRRYIGNESYRPLDGIATEEQLEEANDYSFRAFNSTMVLRWEYRPGSTLYAVWTQARQGIGEYNDLDFRRDVDQLFSRDAYGENVFLIKANYWFNI